MPGFLNIFSLQNCGIVKKNPKKKITISRPVELYIEVRTQKKKATIWSCASTCSYFQVSKDFTSTELWNTEQPKERDYHFEN
jgi:hypothetical protein